MRLFKKYWKLSLIVALGSTSLCQEVRYQSVNQYTLPDSVQYVLIPPDTDIVQEVSELRGEVAELLEEVQRLTIAHGDDEIRFYVVLPDSTVVPADEELSGWLWKFYKPLPERN